MHSINYVRSDGTKTRNRLDARIPDNDVFLSLGDNFDQHDFTKTVSYSYQSLLIERWEQLRKKYSHISLWFSGGRDSRIALDLAIQNNIYIDEICVVRPTLLPDNLRVLNLAEVDVNAIQYLDAIKDKIPNTKINIIEFRDRHFATVYQNPNWVNAGAPWMIWRAWMTVHLFRYFKDEFSLTDGDGAVNVLGAIHPHIHTDDNNNWILQFIDLQFQDLEKSVEIFNVADDMPELTKAYADMARNWCIANSVVPKRFAITPNDMRNNMALYQQIKLVNSQLQFPKNWNNWVPENSIPYQINAGFKSTMNLLLCEQQSPQPQGYINYINNTDWPRIEAELQYGGICSKSFVF
tara:strand:- start:3539 stop:4588 length:1050 start_codon:yes stop_codon:yes gene_type:complete